MLRMAMAVCLGLAGCEESSTVQPVRSGAATTTRPANPPSLATTRPLAAPTSQPMAEKTPLLSVPPNGPVPIRRTEVPPLPAGEARVSFDEDHPSFTADPARQIEILRQSNLRLQMKLDDLQEKNDQLTRALLDSRDAGRSLQENLQRSAIVQEIQRRELRELKDRLGEQIAAERQAAHPATDAAAPAEEEPSKDPMRLLRDLARLRRENEKLRLQLRLVQRDTPDARHPVLLKLGEVTEENEKLQRLNRKLSHTVVVQADQIRQLQARQEEWNRQRVEYTEKLARLEQQRRKELADLELRLARQEQELAALRRAQASAEASSSPSPAGASAAREPAETAGEPSPTATPAPSPGTEVASPPATAAPLTGTISAIKGLLVLIDIGKRDGLEEGMRLIVYREDQFVGYLRVEQVGLREAACTFTRQILPARVGDHVIDRLE